jgi:hypothetical protein
MLKSGFMAQYAVGRAFLVPETTPEAATATLAKLKARFTGAEPSGGLGDEAFSAQDQYLGRLLVFRKGARVAGVANAAAGSDPTPLAKALAGRLP